MLVFFCMLYMVVTIQLTKGQLQTSWKTLPVFPKRCFNTSLSRHWVSKNIRVLHSHLEYFLLELSGTCFLETSFDCSGTLVVRLLKVPKHTALTNYVLFISTVHSRVDFHTKKNQQTIQQPPLVKFQHIRILSKFLCPISQKNRYDFSLCRILNSTNRIWQHILSNFSMSLFYVALVLLMFAKPNDEV